MKSNAEAAVLTPVRTRTADFVALAKPRLNLLVVGSALAGYAMAGGDPTHVFRMLATIVGTALVAGGASAYNQILERKTDALMQRTRRRPLPDGRLQVGEALIFASALSALGIATLAAGVNTLCAVVAFATLISYVGIYTPLKGVTSFATVIGAIPGALPPVIGWTAAREELNPGAWLLFGIVFLWQLPHFLAIAWMFREDYARAGFPMLPVLEPDGRSTGRQAMIYAAALLPLSLGPTLIGITGRAILHRRPGPGGHLPDADGEVRDEPQPARCAAAVLRFDHLPAAALDPDDRQPRVTLADLPALNATLNGTCAVLLTIGYLLIRRRRIRQHRRVMIAAFVTSTLFLTSYLIYHANIGSKPFPGTGAIRLVYLTILVTHILLAMAIVPMALITLSRALRERFDRHAAIARWTLPIWLYVSITGVVVYVMLYKLY